MYKYIVHVQYYSNDRVWLSTDLLAEVNLAERAAAEVLDARANTAKPADSGQGSGPGTGPGLSPKGTSPSPSPSGEPKSKSTSTSWTGLSLADVLARLRRPRAQLVQAIGGETGAGSGAKEGAGPAAAQSTDTLLLHYLLGGLEILHPLLSSGTNDQLVRVHAVYLSRARVQYSSIVTVHLSR